MEEELISRAELREAGHKQGFATLEDFAHAVIEPGGTLTFIGKTPSADLMRHREAMQRLEQMTTELAQLRAARSGRPA